MNAVMLGAELAARRVQSPRLLTALVLGLLACVLSAALERGLSPSGAVDRALVRGSFGILLPLVGYAAFARILRGGSMDALLRPLSRHGASGRALWVGVATVLVGTMAVVGTMFATATVLTARTLTDPALLADLPRSASVGALAGAGYGAWLILGSSLGRAGGGRKWLLLLDLAIGTSGSALAPFCLRPHVSTLLGGEPLLEQSPREATLLLVASTLFALVAARGRVAD
jgi:hypothetical protein